MIELKYVSLIKLKMVRQTTQFIPHKKSIVKIIKIGEYISKMNANKKKGLHWFPEMTCLPTEIMNHVSSFLCFKERFTLNKILRLKEPDRPEIDSELLRLLAAKEDTEYLYLDILSRRIKRLLKSEPYVYIDNYDPLAYEGMNKFLLHHRSVYVPFIDKIKPCKDGFCTRRDVVAIYEDGDQVDTYREYIHPKNKSNKRSVSANVREADTYCNHICRIITRVSDNRPWYRLISEDSISEDVTDIIQIS